MKNIFKINTVIRALPDNTLNHDLLADIFMQEK